MNTPERQSEPLAYFITFSCYGSWLHGDQRHSVDDSHNQYGEEFHPVNPETEQHCQRLMNNSAYELDFARREIVKVAIIEVCEYRGWALLALHVRSTHIHAVVKASIEAERILNDWKAYSTRALNRAKIDPEDCKRWTRHGSTKYLWSEDQVCRSIEYTLNKQGKRMETFSQSLSEPRP